MAQKVRFVPRSPNLPFTALTLIYSYKNRRIIMATGVTIPTKFWDAKARRVKSSRDYPHHGNVNARLNEIERITVGLWLEYQAKMIVPSTDTFKAELSRRLDEVEQEAPELLPFLEAITEERRKMKKSVAAHTNLTHHLKGYQAARKKEVTFSDLSRQLVNDFTSYLFTQRTAEGLSLADSYINKLLVTLRSIARQADERGVYSDSPILRIKKMEVTAKKADNIYLNESELLQLFRLEIEPGSRLDKVRDAFLIGAYTGLRFSDYTHIRPENFQDVQHGDKVVRCLVVTTKKTKKRVTIPAVHHVLVAILERNGWSSPRWGNRGKDAISNQKLNTYLKELGKIAGFTSSIEVNEFRAGGHEKKVMEKWELLTTHTARRSFATNAFKAGVPVKNIMEFTGHATVAQFMDYIKATSEETAVVLADHSFFTGEAKLKKVE